MSGQVSIGALISEICMLWLRLLSDAGLEQLKEIFLLCLLFALEQN